MEAIVGCGMVWYGRVKVKKGWYSREGMEGMVGMVGCGRVGMAGRVY